jgi:hypothetical protein
MSTTDTTLTSRYDAALTRGHTKQQDLLDAAIDAHMIALERLDTSDRPSSEKIPCIEQSTKLLEGAERAIFERKPLAELTSGSGSLPGFEPVVDLSKLSPAEATVIKSILADPTKIVSVITGLMKDVAGKSAEIEGKSAEIQTLRASKTGKATDPIDSHFAETRRELEKREKELGESEAKVTSNKQALDSAVQALQAERVRMGIELEIGEIFCDHAVNSTRLRRTAPYLEIPEDKFTPGHLKVIKNSSVNRTQVKNS